MKTLYVTDLDGTLLNTEDRVSEYSINTINRLMEKGMLFTYATARSLVSASVVTQGLVLDMPVIVYNGCLVVHEKSGKVLSSIQFTREEREKAIEVIKANQVSPLVYSYIEGKESVSWNPSTENEGVQRYLSLRKGDRRLRPVEDNQLYDGEIFYYTCIGERDKLLPIYEALSQDDRYRCTLAQELYREEYWCEIMPSAATKANAIKKLKELYNCEKVIAFGDAVNDKNMLAIADECYAVENAVPELKACATGIISCNDEDGVAKWLEEHVR
jgi:5-amino-6-(5-phospho-D-ribitylamino)uracil phosphatase